MTTSDIRGAGTDANVFIQLFGEKNDSGKINSFSFIYVFLFTNLFLKNFFKGKIKLETSKNHKNKFEQGQTDLFEVKEADVGELRKIR